MKKFYSKPQIIFENFSLSTDIASCGKKIDTQSKGSCGIDMGSGDIVFVDGPCVTGVPDGYNGICYDVPVDANQLFNS